MITTRQQIADSSTRAPVPKSRALVWGNNAAWLCIGCGELLGNRTGDSECAVSCSCGHRYEIARGLNKSGSRHLGPALGVILVSRGRGS